MFTKNKVLVGNNKLKFAQQLYPNLFPAGLIETLAIANHCLPTLQQSCALNKCSGNTLLDGLGFT